MNSARRVVGSVGGFVAASAFALLVLLSFLTGIAIGFGVRVGRLMGQAFKRGYDRGVRWKTASG